MERYAGIDLGATNTGVLVADATGRSLGEATRETPSGSAAAAVTDGVVTALEEACAAAGIEPTELVAVGIASAGPVDTEAGAVANLTNLDVGRVPVCDPVADRIGGGRVRLLNDATAGVIAQRVFGEAAHDDLVYLTISTGIGAGVCADGRVLRGHTDNAAEVGHFVVDAGDGMECGCGGTGHWEAYCSGRNLPRYARRLHERLDVETALPIGAPGFDAATLFEHADTDPLARETLDRAGARNAAGVAGVVHAYDPEAIYVGGAVALNNPDRVLEPIRDRLPELTVRPPPPVRLTSLGDAACLRGALASVLPD